MSTFTGHLPYSDELQERIENSEHGQVGTKGFKYVNLVDASGNDATPISGTIVSGTKTVTTAGTAVQVSVASVAIKGIWVCADLLAGIVVTVGDSSVVGNVSGMKGLVLTPGNLPIFLAISNLNLLWVDAQSNGGKLAYLYTS